MKNIIVTLLGISLLIACSKEDYPVQDPNSIGFADFARILKITGVNGDTVILKNNTGDTVFLKRYYYKTKKDSALVGITDVSVIAKDTFKILPQLKSYKFIALDNYNFYKDTVYLYYYYSPGDTVKADTTLVDMFLPVKVGKKF